MDLCRRITEFAADIAKRDSAVIVADIVGYLRYSVLIRGAAAADDRKLIVGFGKQHKK